MITKESVKDKAVGYYPIYLYSHGDWKWKDKDRFVHLVRDGIELTKGLKAVYCFSYPNGDWEWEDKDGNAHEVKCNKKGGLK